MPVGFYGLGQTSDLMRTWNARYSLSMQAAQLEWDARHLQLVRIRTTEQAIKRLATRFPQEIPQRDVDGRNAVLDYSRLTEMPKRHQVSSKRLTVFQQNR